MRDKTEERKGVRGSKIGKQHRGDKTKIAKKKKKAVLYNLIFYFNKGVYYRINVAKNLG